MSGRSGHVRNELRTAPDPTLAIVQDSASTVQGDTESSEASVQISVHVANLQNAHNEALARQAEQLWAVHGPVGEEISTVRNIMDVSANFVRSGFGFKKKNKEKELSSSLGASETPNEHQNEQEDEENEDRKEEPDQQKKPVKVELLPSSNTSSIDSAQKLELTTKESRQTSKATTITCVVRFIGPRANNVEIVREEEKVDTDLWLDSGDVFVYLAAETETGPEAMPSFRLKSSDLKKIDSMVLITLLNENERSRSSIMGLSTVVCKALDNPRASINLAGLLEMQKKHIDGVKYTIFIAPPPGCEGDHLVCWKRATRNVLALLHDRPPIGYYNKVSEILTGIYDRIIEWIQEPARAKTLVQEYMIKYGLSDVCTRPELAVSLLLYAEHSKCVTSFRDGFVHCVGQHSTINKAAEFATLSPFIKDLITMSGDSLDLRQGRCSIILKEFSLDSIWQLEHPMFRDVRLESPHAYAACKSLAGFFQTHYAASYGKWPPVKGDDWLTRPMARSMKSDFDALYDFLVDRDVTWRESPDLQGCRYLCSDNGNTNSLLSKHLPIAEMVRRFDQMLLSQPPLPFPFPLLPESIPVQEKKSSFFGRKEKKKKDGKKNKDKDSKKEEKERHTREIANTFKVAYNNATNLRRLGNDYTGNSLVVAFLAHEKGENVGLVDPQVVRRGRWILIYGIVQLLTTICLDTPKLTHHEEEIPYFLCADFNGVPNWCGNELVQAEPTESHCYVVWKTWGPFGQRASMVSEVGSRALGSEKSEAKTLIDGSANNAMTLLQNRQDVGAPHIAFNANDDVYQAAQNPGKAVEHWRGGLPPPTPQATPVVPQGVQLAPSHPQQIRDFRERSLPPLPVEAHAVQRSPIPHQTTQQRGVVAQLNKPVQQSIDQQREEHPSRLPRTQQPEHNVQPSPRLQQHQQAAKEAHARQVQKAMLEDEEITVPIPAPLRFFPPSPGPRQMPFRDPVDSHQPNFQQFAPHQQVPRQVVNKRSMMYDEEERGRPGYSSRGQAPAHANGHTAHTTQTQERERGASRLETPAYANPDHPASHMPMQGRDRGASRLETLPYANPGLPASTVPMQQRERVMGRSMQTPHQTGYRGPPRSHPRPSPAQANLIHVNLAQHTPRVEQGSGINRMVSREALNVQHHHHHAPPPISGTRGLERGVGRMVSREGLNSGHHHDYPPLSHSRGLDRMVNHMISQEGLNASSRIPVPNGRTEVVRVASRPNMAAGIDIAAFPPPPSYAPPPPPVPSPRLRRDPRIAEWDPNPARR